MNFFYNPSFFLSRRRYAIAILKHLTLKKILNLVHCYVAYLLRWKTSGAVPPVVILILTYKCNFRCIMCQKSSIDENEYHNPQTMDFAALKRFIERYGDRITILRLFGGEPLFHPQINEVIDLVHAHNIAYAIGTNGSLLTSPIAEKIAGRCAWVSISLDSADDEIYAQIRAGGELETLRSNLSLMRELKQQKRTEFPVINGNATIFTYNLDGIDQLIHFCRSYDIESLSVSAGKLYNTPEVKEQHLIQNQRENARPIVDRARKLALDLNFNLRVAMKSLYLAPRSDEQKQLDFGKRNFGLYFETTILPDFNTRAASDGYREMGHMEDQRLEAVWNGPESEYARGRSRKLT